jgi:flavin-dependent dehydrogenase
MDGVAALARSYLESLAPTRVPANEPPRSHTATNRPPATPPRSGWEDLANEWASSNREEEDPTPTFPMFPMGATVTAETNNSTAVTETALPMAETLTTLKEETTLSMETMETTEATSFLTPTTETTEAMLPTEIPEWQTEVPSETMLPEEAELPTAGKETDFRAVETAAETNAPPKFSDPPVAVAVAPAMTMTKAPDFSWAQQSSSFGGIKSQYGTRGVASGSNTIGGTWTNLADEWAAVNGAARTDPGANTLPSGVNGAAQTMASNARGSTASSSRENDYDGDGYWSNTTPERDGVNQNSNIPPPLPMRRSQPAARSVPPLPPMNVGLPPNNFLSKTASMASAASTRRANYKDAATLAKEWALTGPSLKSDEWATRSPMNDDVTSPPPMPYSSEPSTEQLPLRNLVDNDTPSSPQRMPYTSELSNEQLLGRSASAGEWASRSLIENDVSSPSSRMPYTSEVSNEQRRFRSLIDDDLSSPSPRTSYTSEVSNEQRRFRSLIDDDVSSPPPRMPYTSEVSNEQRRFRSLIDDDFSSTPPHMPYTSETSNEQVPFTRSSFGGDSRDGTEVGRSSPGDEWVANGPKDDALSSSVLSKGQVPYRGTPFGRKSVDKPTDDLNNSPVYEDVSVPLGGTPFKQTNLDNFGSPSTGTGVDKRSSTDNWVGRSPVDYGERTPPDSSYSSPLSKGQVPFRGVPYGSRNFDTPRNGSGGRSDNWAASSGSDVTESTLAASSYSSPLSKGQVSFNGAVSKRKNPDSFESPRAGSGVDTSSSTKDQATNGVEDYGESTSPDSSYSSPLSKGQVPFRGVPYGSRGSENPSTGRGVGRSSTTKERPTNSAGDYGESLSTDSSNSSPLSKGQVPFRGVPYGSRGFDSSSTGMVAGRSSLTEDWATSSTGAESSPVDSSSSSLLNNGQVPFGASSFKRQIDGFENSRDGAGVDKSSSATEWDGRGQEQPSSGLNGYGAGVDKSSSPTEWASRGQEQPSSGLNGYQGPLNGRSPSKTNAALSSSRTSEWASKKSPAEESGAKFAQSPPSKARGATDSSNSNSVYEQRNAKVIASMQVGQSRWVKAEIERAQSGVGKSMQKMYVPSASTSLPMSPQSPLSASPAVKESSDSSSSLAAEWAPTNNPREETAMKDTQLPLSEVRGATASSSSNSVHEQRKATDVISASVSTKSQHAESDKGTSAQKESARAASTSLPMSPQSPLSASPAIKESSDSSSSLAAEWASMNNPREETVTKDTQLPLSEVRGATASSSSNSIFEQRKANAKASLPAGNTLSQEHVRQKNPVPPKTKPPTDPQSLHWAFSSKEEQLDRATQSTDDPHEGGKVDERSVSPGNTNVFDTFISKQSGMMKQKPIDLYGMMGKVSKQAKKKIDAFVQDQKQYLNKQKNIMLLPLKQETPDDYQPGFDTTGMTERIMKRIPVEGQAGGAGGQSTWDGFLRAEENWKRMRTFDPKTSEKVHIPDFVIEDGASGNPAAWTKLMQQQNKELDYDIVVCGGTLGIFFATALQLQGFSVCVVEAGKLRGREQEWNLSMDELLELVELGVLSEDDIDTALKTDFPACRSGFKNREENGLEGGYFDNGVGFETATDNVLNLGISPAVLLDLVKEKFKAIDGVIKEESPLRAVHISETVGAALDFGSDKAPITGRLVLDCMGNASPISRQQRQGVKPDGVCAVVGSCAAGFDKETNLIGDIIYTNSEMEDKGDNGMYQYFWEAFPVGIGKNGQAPGSSDVKTTYLFTYMDAHEKRISLGTLMDDYWRLLPKYQPSIQNPETDLDFRRVLFAYFPTYRDSPLKPKWDRILAVGDASGIQSPLSFGGFGALTRNLGRISDAVGDALTYDLLAKEDLGQINAYLPNLSAAWMFQKAMSVRMGKRVDPKFVNRLLAVNFEAMDGMGDRTMRPFLQDVVRFDGLVGSLLRSFQADPTFMPQIVAHVGIPTLAEWVGHVSTMGTYGLLDTVVTPVFKPVMETTVKSERTKFQWRRRMEAWKFGSGNDYKMPPKK